MFLGDICNVVTENVDRKKLYAIMPGSSQHSGKRSLVHDLHCDHSIILSTQFFEFRSQVTGNVLLRFFTTFS